MRASILCILCTVLFFGPTLGIALERSPAISAQTLHPDQDIQRVRELAKIGKYKQALDILTPYQDLAEKYPKIYTDYLVLLVWAGRHREAVQRFEELPRFFVKRLYLLEAMGKAYAAEERYRKAVDLYQQVLELDPENEQAKIGLIRNLIKLGQFQRAERLLDTYLKANPDQVALQLIQAGLLLRRGQYLAALKKYRELSARHELERERIALHREREIGALSSARRKEMLNLLAQRIADGHREFFEDYLISLILHSDYGQALQEFEKSGRRLEECSVTLRYWIGWAYFKRGKITNAKRIFEAILRTNPDYERAKLGIIYCIATEGRRNKAKTDEALKMLAELNPKTTDERFARAYILEQSGRLWEALQLYDEILSQTKSRLAKKLKLQVIASLGAPSIALDLLTRTLPDDRELQYSFRGDFAMRDIRWHEPAKAQKELVKLMQENDILRNRYDYLIALAENDDLEATKNLYEEFVRENIFRPYWVKNNAAKAYLHFDEPRKALRLYNEVLEDNPDIYETRLGKFYALQDLRLWKEAEEVLAGLGRDYPLFRETKRGRRGTGDKGEEIAIVKGWALVSQDRFQEAQNYFGELYRHGPANLRVRNGLAHTHYWRGWPRRALREFNIINSLDPDYVSAATGRISVLNELAHKEEARQCAKELLEKYPKNKNIQRVNFLLDIEQMRELVTDVVWYREEPNSEDLLVKIALYQPVGLYTRLYGFWLWNETSDTELMYHVKRAGIGVDHIFNTEWKIRQQFSINYETGEEFGSLTKVDFTPNDYWHFMAAYDSFAVDIPMRARVYGIGAKKYEAAATLRESDLRSYAIGATRYDFSDGNNRDQLSLQFRQSLWTTHDWKFRLLFDWFGSKNSRQDAPYFNPDHDYSLTSTLLVEKLVRRTTFTSFKHRLFLTGGIYDQADYEPEPLWSVRYEQEYDFSDEHALLIGATWTNRAYDGIAQDSLALYFTYRYHF